MSACTTIVLGEGDRLVPLPPAVSPEAKKLIDATSGLIDDVRQQYQMTGQDPMSSPMYRRLVQQLTDLKLMNERPRFELVRA